MKSRAVILVNVGTPESPAVKDVRKYLSQFLNDPGVIDIPPFFRKMLVELIIVPFRAPRSAKLYSRLWTEKGSPLLVHLQNLLLRIQGSGDPTNVNGASVPHSEPVTVSFYVAMRYGNPSLKGILEHARDIGHDHITVFPLYPQYSSATTGSVIDLVNKVTGGWGATPKIDTVRQFYNSCSFIKPMAAKIRAAGSESCDRIVFSYHGLP
ncbi:MAG: ferrochelatase, partial [Bacteroidales bacterium]|nr:ferrochelatase [Bacteroidales bacterium]